MSKKNTEKKSGTKTTEGNGEAEEGMEIYMVTEGDWTWV